VLYGLSIYSVFAATWNQDSRRRTVFRLKDHYQRLINSAKILDFHQFVEEWTYETFETTMIELLKRNQPQEDVLVRVTVFIDELVAGTKIHGLKNAVSAYVYPMGEILPRSGINVCVSSWQRTADNAVPSRAKINGSYVNASLMKNEAILNGYDEAIALDEHGHVTEGTVANVFLVKNGVLITPDTATDMLEGITRDSIITLAKEQGIICEQRAVDRSELYTAEEAFMCGSSALVTPILSVDKRPIGNGAVGPLTTQLTTLYKNVQTGADARHSDWRLLV
jgi:branched-chain amino acid aminotransferase